MLTGLWGAGVSQADRTSAFLSERKTTCLQENNFGARYEKKEK